MKPIKIFYGALACSFIFPLTVLAFGPDIDPADRKEEPKKSEVVFLSKDYISRSELSDLGVDLEMITKEKANPEVYFVAKGSECAKFVKLRLDSGSLVAKLENAPANCDGGESEEESTGKKSKQKSSDHKSKAIFLSPGKTAFQATIKERDEDCISSGDSGCEKYVTSHFGKPWVSKAAKEEQKRIIDGTRECKKLKSSIGALKTCATCDLKDQEEKLEALAEKAKYCEEFQIVIDVESKKNEFAKSVQELSCKNIEKSLKEASLDRLTSVYSEYQFQTEGEDAPCKGMKNMERVGKEIIWDRIAHARPTDAAQLEDLVSLADEHSQLTGITSGDVFSRLSTDEEYRKSIKDKELFSALSKGVDKAYNSKLEECKKSPQDQFCAMQLKDLSETVSSMKPKLVKDEALLAKKQQENRVTIWKCQTGRMSAAECEKASHEMAKQGFSEVQSTAGMSHYGFGQELNPAVASTGQEFTGGMVFENPAALSSSQQEVKNTAYLRGFQSGMVSPPYNSGAQGGLIYQNQNAQPQIYQSTSRNMVHGS
jgi:hypothetical protein